jgi:hypothetical protein
MYNSEHYQDLSLQAVATVCIWASHGRISYQNGTGVWGIAWQLPSGQPSFVLLYCLLYFLLSNEPRPLLRGQLFGEKNAKREGTRDCTLDKLKFRLTVCCHCAYSFSERP